MEDEKNKTLEDFKRITDALKVNTEESNKNKHHITTCEWCGMTYPKGGWTYYKILVRNMDVEKLVEKTEKGIKKDDFDRHIICSDCYDRLKICEEC